MPLPIGLISVRIPDVVRVAGRQSLVLAGRKYLAEGNANHGDAISAARLVSAWRSVMDLYHAALR